MKLWFCKYWVWVDTIVIYASFTLRWFFPPSTSAQIYFSLNGLATYTCEWIVIHAVFHCTGYEIHWRKIGGKWFFYANIPLLCIQFFKGGRVEGAETSSDESRLVFILWTVWWKPQLSAAKNWTASNIVIITLNCQKVCYDTVAFVLFNTLYVFP